MSAPLQHRTSNNTTSEHPQRLDQRHDSTGALARSSELASKAVVNQPLPHFNSYLPPSPPRSRSPSPYGLGGAARHDSSSSSAAGAGSEGPRLRMSTATATAATTSTYLQPQYSPSGSTSPKFGHSSPTMSSPAISTGTIQRKHSQNGDLPYRADSSQVEAVPGEHLHHVNFNHPYANGYANGHANGNFDHHHPPQARSPLSASFPGAASSLANAPFINSIYNKANGLIKELPFAPHSSAGLPTNMSTPRHHLQPPSSTHAHNRRHSVAQAITPSISTVRFASLCALWYTSSALSSNTGKSIMNRFKYPVTLTFIQFGFVAGWCIMVCVGRSKFAQLSAKKQNNRGHHSRALSVGQLHAASGWGIKKPTKKALEGTLVMSGFQIAGHIFSSMAIARVPVSTVHTIKALSPLFTVMSYALLFRVRYSYNTYVSLLPLTVGVMLACSFDLRANAPGLFCALGSTLVFVSQNIFSKKLLPKEGQSDHGASSEGKLDKLHLLLYSSGLAFILMIPLWAYYDGYKLLFGTNVIRTASIPTLIFFYTLNGSVHFLQNLLAFSILSLCSPVTYSIASLIKRIAVICMAIVWFGQTVYPIQAVGISMTFLGLWMYNQAKKDVERGENLRTKVERRGSVLLPTSKEDLSDSDNPKAKGWTIVR